jgi:hypothetical protein
MARRKKTDEAGTEGAPSAAQAGDAGAQPVKRGRGRPRKDPADAAALAAPVKRGRGRPRKSETGAPAARKGGRGRPRKASPAIGKQIDDLIRQLQSIKEQVTRMEASAGTLDKVLSVLKS